MVKLIPMQEADFDAYVERSIRDYAEEHVKNGSWPPDQALELSRREFRALLPDGLKSKKQFVVIAAGGGNKYNTTFSDALVAFALP